jgi:tetratricopeptide (TPR) repeat protein
LALVGLVAVTATGALVVEHAIGERRYARLVQAGQQALDAGNSYEAIEAFTGALTLRPESMVAFYRRGEAYRAERREDEAIRDFRTAMRLAPSAPEPLVALGDIFAGDDSAQAASWYGRAARLRADDPALLYKLALAHYRAGAPAEAMQPLQDALARNDSLASAHYLLGLVYRDLQRLDESIASMERALKLTPGLAPAREELADIYRVRGQYAFEMNQLQALAALEDASGRLVRIGLAEAGQGEFPAAVETLEAAAARNPTDSQVQLALARVHLARAERLGDESSVAQALEALEQALGGSARRSEGLALYGRALTLAGEHAGAERILREAIATSPVASEAFAYLADAAEALGNFVAARDALVTLDVLEGDTATTAARAARAERIGVLSLRAGDHRTAVGYLARAVAAGRGTLHTLGRLAEARWLSGDAAGARAALDEALALEPDHPELASLRRRLLAGR